MLLLTNLIYWYPLLSFLIYNFGIYTKHQVQYLANTKNLTKVNFLPLTPLLSSLNKKALFYVQAGSALCLSLRVQDDGLPVLWESSGMCDRHSD